VNGKFKRARYDLAVKQQNLTRAQIASISSDLFVRSAIAPSDLLFIFGNRVCEDAYGVAAGALWRAGFFQSAMVSGGPTGEHSLSEAEVIVRKLIVHGVPEDRILLETKAKNTGENVELALRILRNQEGFEAIRSVLAMGMVCTSRRYLMTLERYWPEVRKSLFAINHFDRPLDDWPNHHDMRQRIIGEWRKLSTYKEKGFIIDWKEDAA